MRAQGTEVTFTDLVPWYAFVSLLGLIAYFYPLLLHTTTANIRI